MRSREARLVPIRFCPGKPDRGGVIVALVARGQRHAQLRELNLLLAECEIRLLHNGQLIDDETPGAAYFTTQCFGGCVGLIAERD